MAETPRTPAPPGPRRPVHLAATAEIDAAASHTLYFRSAGAPTGVVLVVPLPVGVADLPRGCG
jgi:hypothetical protein